MALCWCRKPLASVRAITSLPTAVLSGGQFSPPVLLGSISTFYLLSSYCPSGPMLLAGAMYARIVFYFTKCSDSAIFSFKISAGFVLYSS